MTTATKTTPSPRPAGPQSAQEAPRYKVSVVIPTYNTGETILTGLAALRAQSMPREEFEVVYVDDGSTDGTPDLLEEALVDEPSMRLIRADNSGWPGRPRNLGTAAAHGEYVHYVDDDDWLAPKALEKLYARARETGADIVAGRMAGHGRGAPRAPFARPMAAGTFRQDAVLTGTMTVHKLFRTSFLRRHALSFPEGRVRLEDHIFMLRAYLLAERVATVHDYTCYHWVRHTGGQHNISYRRIDPHPYLASIRSVLAVLDAPDTRVADGPVRRRLIANWYGNKALKRLTGKRLVGLPDEERAQWYSAVCALAADLPPEVDAHLPVRLRVVSALARYGDHDLLDRFASFEADIAQEPHLDAAQWVEGALNVEATTRLVHRGRAGGHSDPVLFVRSERPDGTPRYHWHLPAELARVPGIDAASDFTAAVARARVAPLLRHRRGRTELLVRADSSVEEVPVATAQDDGTHLVELRFRTVAAVDPRTADAGRKLASGAWDVLLRLSACGWLSAPRLAGLTVHGPGRAPLTRRRRALTWAAATCHRLLPPRGYALARMLYRVVTRRKDTP
ncbi:glycosyltransferase family 2 protein [Streptomyces sp. NPDC047123]|uniref:glycosyltransferase family 2 protein n=1 Tax=Streptomyces sp. NPDC047123 TaxID=3155622 RepID=UPI0033D7146F